MAEAVGHALADGRHLLVQAGTGTGKSLGYLIPALVHAVREHQRIVVATATLVLQRQITEHDLPIALDAIGESPGRRPRAALLKGRQNYLCLLKLDGAYGEEDDEVLIDRAAARGGTGSPFAEEVRRLTGWAAETRTGDRDDVPGGVTARAWRQMAVTAAQCVGSKCPMIESCFSERARAAAHAADLVVTNHAMLAVQAGIMAAGASKAVEGDGSPRGMLPEHGALILDEAHQLTRSVTSALTGVLTPASARFAARAARRTGGRGGSSGAAADALDGAAQRLEEALAVQVALGEGPGVGPPGAEARGSAVVRFGRGLPDGVVTALQSVRAAARTAFSEVGAAKANRGSEPGSQGSGERPGETAAALTTAAEAALTEVIGICDRLEAAGAGGAPGGGPPGDVIWLAADPSGELSLNVAPLDVSGPVKAGLLDHATAVMTSATLTLGGRMEPAAEAAGLEDGEWDGLDVGSPFDYGSQGILYVARDLPVPGRDTAHRGAQQERLRELIEASGGGALGLFTSLDAAREAAEALRDGFDFPVLLQGDKSLPSLLEEFLEDEDACLFGANTLWQGVDAPGKTCRLVAIDRLAFPRPDDPVQSARAAAADRAGRSGFMTVSAAHAALMLAQGAGRLIRTASDKGVVAVLDQRLATKRYGAFLIRSMPPMWRTESLEQATGALRRLASAKW
jgi:ATP-dependent DNA helicase DinG